VRRIRELVAIDDQAERAVRRVERTLGDALDDAFGSAAVMDESVIAPILRSCADANAIRSGMRAIVRRPS
jgi:hypothetical protein